MPPSLPAVNRIVLFTAVERLALGLRRLGLGALVDRLRRFAERALGRFTATLDGLLVTGVAAYHSGYVRELKAGRESYSTELLVEALPLGGTAVDGGAHLGYITLQAARAVGPAGRVYAFEPNPDTHGLLVENIRANGFEDRIVAPRTALADRDGRTAFFVAVAGDESGLHPGAGARRIDVGLTRADHVLPTDAVVDVVKLDVEGGEIGALLGMDGLLRRASADAKLFVECNPEALTRLGGDARRLVEVVRRLGFEPRVIDEEHRRLRPVGDTVEVESYVNLLCERTSGSASSPL